MRSHLRSSVLAISIFSFSYATLSFGKEFKIDSGHSNVQFVARHLVSKVNGEFQDFDGEFSFDPKNPSKAMVKADIKVDSINTKIADRDKHLKSKDFFDSEKFPTLRFVSNKFVAESDNKYKMSGDLTMHGITKPVTFDVEYLGAMDDPSGNHRVGFTASSKINRKDFGMNWNKALDKGGFVLGDDVQININIEGVEKAIAKKKGQAAPSN
jgi:polyisoprenoid-binding protein YceI